MKNTMKTLRTLSAILCIVAFSTSAIAATPEETAKQAVITVSLYDVTVAQAIQSVSKLSGVKTHYAAPTQGDLSITMSLTNITATEAFRYVADLANLTVSYKDDGAHFAAKQ